jgi:hypothetical protein
MQAKRPDCSALGRWLRQKYAPKPPCFFFGKNQSKNMPICALVAYATKAQIGMLVFL